MPAPPAELRQKSGDILDITLCAWIVSQESGDDLPLGW